MPRVISSALRRQAGQTASAPFSNSPRFPVEAGMKQCFTALSAVRVDKSLKASWCLMPPEIYTEQRGAGQPDRALSTSSHWAGAVGNKQFSIPLPEEATAELRGPG